MISAGTANELQRGVQTSTFKGMALNSGPRHLVGKVIASMLTRRPNVIGGRSNYAIIVG